MQPGKPETTQEKAVRLARQAGAAYPEAVAAVLEPFEQQTCGGASLFAKVDDRIMPYETALAKTRDEDSVLGPLFQPDGKPDVRKLTPRQYRAIRANAPQLIGLRPKR